MSAYVMAQVDVKDAAAYEDYKKRVPATVAKFGGTFIARGGEIENLEGDWAPKRMVIIKFPDLATAKAWWSSEEYAKPKAMRQAASVGSLIVVEGVA